MKRSFYSERDYAFGQTILNLRTSMGLTQSELADLLGVSRRAVGEWEAGGSYPKVNRLKQLIELGIKRQAFPTGHEAEAIRTLWAAARQKVLLNEQWLSELLAQQLPPSHLAASQLIEAEIIDEPRNAQLLSEPRVDWGNALAFPNFYGREQEIAQLTQWILRENCQVVSLLGMGGIGKSALAVKGMYQIAKHFDIVIFRSLRDAPSCEELLDDCLQVLASQPLTVTPPSLERRISLLLTHLRTEHILLVLDNLESLLQEGDVHGHLRPGFEGYGRLLRQIAETGHKSCLLLTSREKPAELRPLEGKRSQVRSMRLNGLDTTACEQLFTEKDVMGSQEDQARLIEVYTGNPLALKIVAETITDLFGGAIGQFLAGEAVIFGDIADLLNTQFARLSPLEQTVQYWLAIVREPITLDELLTVLVTPLPRVQVLEAVNGLRQRSLIELGQHQGSFTLQSVVLEYITMVLITEATNELQQGQLDRLLQYGLEQAHAREYVRQTQERLLVVPILTSLQSIYQRQTEVEELLLSQLNQFRTRAEYAQGYGPTNLIALLRLLHGHLRGLDLSHLAIRGAYLQGVEMQDTKLSKTILRDTVFTEAFDATWAVAISSNGKYWAAGSKRGEVRVWEEGGRTLYRTWQAHTDIVLSIAFSPDGRTLASASWDNTVKLWDLDSGALLWTGWHTNNINCVVFASDGSMLASGSFDATVRIWDIQSGTNQQTLLHPGPVSEIVWNSDKHLLASGGHAGQIWLWEVQGTQQATCFQTLTGHTNWVGGVAMAPDGNTLASGGWDGTIKLWEIASGRLLQTLMGHTDRVDRLAWSPDGCMLASGSRDRTIKLWDIEQSNYRAVLQGHTAEVYSQTFTPDSRNLLSGSEDGTVRLWDIERRQCVHVIQGYAASLFDLDWSPDGTQLVSGGADTQIVVWDVTGKIPPRVLRGHNWTVWGVGWSPDGRWLASSAWDNVIYLWNATSGAIAERQRDRDDPDTSFEGVAWSPDGQRLASGTFMHGVQVWDITTHSQHWIGRQLSTWIHRVAWSPDSTRLAGGGDDGNVYLWDASDGTQIQQLPGHQGGVKSVAWSPDGIWLASGGSGKDSGELFVWKVQSGERVRTIVRHPGVIYAVAWSLSGDMLISGGSDGMLCWWDVQSGECLKEQEAHKGTIQSLRISPDGSKLASCGDDGAIRIWDLHNTEHLQTLRRDRPYERLDITGIRGLTEARKAALRALGAIEHL